MYKVNIYKNYLDIISSPKEKNNNLFHKNKILALYAMQNTRYRVGSLGIHNAVYIIMRNN